jgi:hypothetical protein
MPDPSTDRPKGRETEYEDVKPGSPPRSATEPRGSEGSVKTSKTATDPNSGEAKERPDAKATTPPNRPGP